MNLPSLRVAGPLCLAALFAAACSQVARRPQAGAVPWWEEDAAGADTTLSDAAGRADPGSLEPRSPERRKVDAVDSTGTAAPAVLAGRRRAYRTRNRDDEKRVQEVNEYAFWAVERGMWDEARIHLEQAVARDSLAASLHNNLGIVYERLGKRDRARSEYELAVQLAPEKRLYQSNLRRLLATLESRQTPRNDLQSDELLDPPLGDDRRLPDSVQPKKGRGDADIESP